jgi:ribosomal protein S18 acetylase RimI-like enzyme
MITLFEVDFDNPQHCKDFVALMNHYMSDKMGDYPPHNEESAKRLIEGMKKHPSKLCCFAQSDGEPAGLINCFIGFATFAAKPFINIHDIVVYDTFRGKGIGRKLLEYVIEKAKETGCAKVTLEVREDNKKAQYLYNSLGFKDGTPPMYFWSKHLG